MYAQYYIIIHSVDFIFPILYEHNIRIPQHKIGIIHTTEYRYYILYCVTRI